MSASGRPQPPPPPPPTRVYSLLENPLKKIIIYAVDCFAEEILPFRTNFLKLVSRVRSDTDYTLSLFPENQQKWYIIAVERYSCNSCLRSDAWGWHRVSLELQPSPSHTCWHSTSYDKTDKNLDFLLKEIESDSPHQPHVVRRREEREGKKRRWKRSLR